MCVERDCKGLLLAQQGLDDSFIRCSVPKRFQVTQDIRINFLCIIHRSLDFIQTRWRNQWSARDLPNRLRRKPLVRKDLGHLDDDESISRTFLQTAEKTHGDSLLGILLQHAEQQITNGSLNFIRHIKDPGFDFEQQDSNVVVVKRQATGDQCE